MSPPVNMPSLAMTPRTVTLLITTYNWEAALERVLASVALQTRLPDEVVVADDGSGPATRALLERLAPTFPCRLLHSWQEDTGFRVARSRNRAIAAASGEYLVMIDGDMVMHPRFIADHLAFARPGAMLQGSRLMTTPASRERMLAEPGYTPGLFTGGLERRRHCLRIPALARRYLDRHGGRPHAVKTCNQSWWRADLLRVNGFDERMEGWGREDEELAWRGWHAGIACLQLRAAGLAIHLHHRERHLDGASPNDALLAESLAEQRTRCTRGVDQHLADFAAHPLPDLRDLRGASAA